MAQAGSRLRSSLPGFGCALLAVVAILATHPVLEAGFADDWSYARICLDFLRSGRIVYDGWCNSILIPHVMWGALAAKLFGFSFLTLRLSTLPFVAGSALLLFSLARRFGLTPRHAVLATLTVILSPVFVPLGASFMTDIPGFFWILLCFYGCARAACSGNVSRATAWLVMAALASLIGGSSRQIVWLGALVAAPSTAWLLRWRRGLPVRAAILWLISLLVVLACLNWFRQQPYSVPEAFPSGAMNLPGIVHLSRHMAAFFATALLFSLPCLVLFLPSLLEAPKVWIISLAGACSGAVWLKALAPCMQGVVTAAGVSGDLDSLVANAPVLTMPVRVAITWLLMSSLWAFVYVIWREPWKVWLGMALSKVSFVWIFGPFCLAYIALLVPRAAAQGVIGVGLFDRYSIPLLPILLILILRIYQERINSQAPLIAFGVLAIFAAYAVASTHDNFALERAREEAVTELGKHGVSRSEIQAGFESDGWAQLEMDGHINDPRIELPPGSFRRVLNTMPNGCGFWFSDRAPAIHPVYFVEPEASPCLRPTAFASVPYSGWIPPYQHEMLIETAR